MEEIDLENYKIVKRMEKISELARAYIAMAMNKHKTVGAQKFRENAEYEAITEIIKEVNVIATELGIEAENEESE
jgi:hypothetical protein